MPIQEPNTYSTLGMLKMIRNRILTFVPMDPGTGDVRTVADRLGTYGLKQVPRFWFETVPDDVAAEKEGIRLWAMMQLIPSKQHGDDGGFMRRGVIEVQFFGRPREATTELSAMADVAEQSLFGWVNRTAEGYIRVLSGIVRTKIDYKEPADREMGQIKLDVSISYAPLFLTQYSS